MNISVLQAKIRNAVITASDVEYKGSITIDQDIMDKMGVVPWQECHVNGKGHRAVTYIIPGKRGSGCVEANGALSYLFQQGDTVHINVYALISTYNAKDHQPNIIESNIQSHES